MKVGGASLNQTPLDWQGNTQRIKIAINEGILQNTEILCFPELVLTGYGCEDLFLSGWLLEKTERILDEIIQVCENITVIIGIPLKYQGHVYNCACVIRNQKILGIIAKQNMAVDGVHYETRWFTPWKSGKVVNIDYCHDSVPLGDMVFDIDGQVIGFEICEDAWRKNRPAYSLRDRDVDIIFNLSASHFALEKTTERQELVISSSKKFTCTYVYVNLLGNEAGRMIYDGEIIIARKGKLLALNQRLSFKDINILSFDLKMDQTDMYVIQENHHEFTREKEFVQATSLALFDYFRKTIVNGFVLSLSGGADSAMCAVLVFEMVKRAASELGWNEFLKKINNEELIDRVRQLDTGKAHKFVVGHILTCAYQATENSSEDTYLAAQNLSNSIGAGFFRWNVDTAIAGYTTSIEKAIGRKLEWEKDDIALQNIQARARSPVIWMLANVKNAILITTSNRSEGDAGYATMDGDTSGSLAPIAGIDKAFIRRWLKWAEIHLGLEGLKKVNSMIPTAELRPPEYNQTDEADLMPYDVMVEIERLAIRDHHAPVEVYGILKQRKISEATSLKNYIAKFFTLWARNQWKRERLAPSFHIDDFNIDPRSWCRFPIISGNFQDELKELEAID